jgi:hypothetical protein
MSNEKLHKHRKNLQNVTHNALKFQINKNDLKSFKKRLYPKHKKSKTTFSLESIPTPITLIYLK